MISSAPKFQHTQGIILLIGVTMLWGTTFPLVKETVISISPGALIAIRCILATLAFAVHLRDLNARLLRNGALLGLLLFASLATQALALETTMSANRAAFIASLNVILVPLLGQLLGQRVLVRTFLAAGLALGGIGVMSWEGGVFGIGDFWMLCDVLSYATYILMLESVTPHHPSQSLTAIQLLVVAVLASLWTAPELMGQIEAIGTNFLPILYLAIVTAATTWLPAVAQNWVSAHETALIYTFEPMFAAGFSFWLLGEKLGVRGWLGAVMVLAAMVLNQNQTSNVTLKVVSFSEEETAIQAIRKAVFIDEEGISPSLAFDNADKTAEHILAYLDEQPVATARIRYVDSQLAKIENLAVLSTARGIGIGKKLMENALEIVEQNHIPKVVIDVPENVREFYKKLGFDTLSEKWTEDSISYVEMSKDLLGTESSLQELEPLIIGDNPVVLRAADLSFLHTNASVDVDEPVNIST